MNPFENITLSCFQHCSQCYQRALDRAPARDLPFTEEVRNTELLSDSVWRAIATYLKSLPPVDGPARPQK